MYSAATPMNVTSEGDSNLHLLSTITPSESEPPHAFYNTPFEDDANSSGDASD
jgi:hypothetical protein